VGQGRIDLVLPDFDTCYRAVSSRDPRFDGRFFTGVSTTGIYCRSICPAQTPRRENVRFYGSAAAAVAAGFRACRRCRPDTVPGSRQWDARGDLAGRALRLIASGAADDGGVAALATMLHVSERHLHRVLVDEVGAGPLALARTRRAQTARLLLDETSLPMSDVAFAAGFASVRQFNDTVREEFGATPTELRRAVRRAPLAAEAGTLALRLRHREPYDATLMLDFLDAHAVPGLEQVHDGTFTRAVRGTDGPVLVSATPADGHQRVRIGACGLADVPRIVAALRRTFDLDADPTAVDDALGGDPLLARSVKARPGLRVPGAPEGFELVIRALLGQRISVAAARMSTAKLVAECGKPLDASSGLSEDGGPTHGFPAPEALAGAELTHLPGRLAGTVRTVAASVADGSLDVEPGVDRDEARAQLLALHGVGPWTADYVAMRGWGDPDAFPETDLILRREVERRGADPSRWRPWRAYAAMHLWTMSTEKEPA
jgi:AraC family transcriptional regulator of adaptative response / DNA-3-methyladenine glycosylase II